MLQFACPSPTDSTAFEGKALDRSAAHDRARSSIRLQVGDAGYIHVLRDETDMTILQAERCAHFTRELADKVAIMDRGEVVCTCGTEGLDDPDVRRHLAI